MVGKDKRSSVYTQKLIILTLAFSLLGCKSLQKITSVANEQYSISTIIENAQQAAPQFNSVEIKKMNLRVNLNDRNQYNSAASCKIMNDSVIYISVQPFFGIEMFVARLTPNEVLFIDKTKNTYYLSDYKFLNMKFDLDLNYNIIQSLFMNKLFVIGEREVKPAMFKKTKERQAAPTLNYENGKYAGNILFRNDFRISSAVVQLKTGEEEFKVNYANFENTGKLINFPYSIKMSVTNASSIFGLDMDISKMSIEEPITIPVLSLNKYRQGDISTLLK